VAHSYTSKALPGHLLWDTYHIFFEACKFSLNQQGLLLNLAITSFQLVPRSQIPGSFNSRSRSTLTSSNWKAAIYNLQSDNYNTALTFFCTKALKMVNQLSLSTSPIPDSYQLKYVVLVITLFRCITLLCGTANIPQRNFLKCLVRMWEISGNILWNIVNLTNIVMNLKEVMILWAFPTPQTFWPWDRIKNCFICLPIANHKNCYSKFQDRNSHVQDYKRSRWKFSFFSKQLWHRVVALPIVLTKWTWNDVHNMSICFNLIVTHVF
jgi:hypothetical protein